MTTPEQAKNLFEMLRLARQELDSAREAKSQAEQNMEDCHQAFADATKAYQKALQNIEAAAKVVK